MPRAVPAILAATRVLAVLEARKRVPVGLTQIAREAGLYKGTCNDILHTLESQGYVVRDPATRGYLLGPALVGLGAMAVADPAYVQVALERLPALNQAVGATCHLLQRIGEDQMQVVGRLDSPTALSIGAPVGQRFPLAIARATARAFLAWLGEDERRAAFERLGNRGFFKEFDQERDRFERDLAQVRAQGYAVARGLEYGLGTDAFAHLAAPIFDRNEQVVLVADVTPVGRQAAPERLPGYAACLVETTSRITRAIGGKLPAGYPGT